MTPSTMSDAKYALFFDVRRSIRYHDRRRAFFEHMHKITGALTVLLAGSVLFDIARPGDNPAWLLGLAAFAAVLSAFDMMIGYTSKAGLHHDLKVRFGALEIAILAGNADDALWQAHQMERLRIEQDEPPTYRALDSLCRNELLRAEGFRDEDGSGHFVDITGWQRVTRHLFHWADIKTA